MNVIRSTISAPSRRWLRTLALLGMLVMLPGCGHQPAAMVEPTITTQTPSTPIVTDVSATQPARVTRHRASSLPPPAWVAMMKTGDDNLGKSKALILNALGPPERVYGLEYWYHPPDWDGPSTLQDMDAPKIGFAFTEQHTLRSVYRNFFINRNNDRTGMEARHVWSYLGAPGTAPQKVYYDTSDCLFFESQHPPITWYATGFLIGKSAHGNVLAMRVYMWLPPAVSKKHFDGNTDRWVVGKYVHNPDFFWGLTQVTDVGIFKSWPPTQQDDRFHTLHDADTVPVE